MRLGAIQRRERGRAGGNTTQKESDVWSAGYPVQRLRAVRVICNACLSSVSTGVHEREKGIHGRERTCVAIAGRMGGLRYGLIYSRIFS